MDPGSIRHGTEGHQDGWQKKKIEHTVDGTNLSGSVLWTPNARDGLWEKNRIVAFDSNGAQRELTRAMIGNGEDCSHSAGTMTLG